MATDISGAEATMWTQYERMRRKKLNFLLNANIFRNCNKNLFTKSFTSFFSKRLLYSHENLFSE